MVCMINWVIQFFFVYRFLMAWEGSLGQSSWSCMLATTAPRPGRAKLMTSHRESSGRCQQQSIAPRSEAWTIRRKKIGCFHHHSRSSHYPHDLFMLSRVVFRCSLFWVDTFCVGFLLFGLASCKKKHVSSFIYTWLRISMVVSSGFLHLEGGNQV